MRETDDTGVDGLNARKDDRQRLHSGPLATVMNVFRAPGWEFA